MVMSALKYVNFKTIVCNKVGKLESSAVLVFTLENPIGTLRFHVSRIASSSFAASDLSISECFRAFVEESLY